MFTIKSIALKNFKCYSDTFVSFVGKNNVAKHMIIMYGANGSGKTTLLESVAFLKASINTLLQQKQLQDTIQGNGVSFSEMPVKPEFILKTLEYSLKKGSLESIIKNSISLGAEGNLEMTFEFFINDGIAVYSIVASDTAIISERLDFPLNKNKTCCFQITNEKKYINENLVINDEYRKYLNSQIDMMYGVHSLLSIMNYDYENSSEDYIKKSINGRFIEFLEGLNNITVYLHDSCFFDSFNGPITNRIFNNLDIGVMNKNEKAILENIEIALPKVIKSIFTDIKDVWFEITDDPKNMERIKYKLFVKRRINGKEYTIPFNKESSGTKKVLELIPIVLSAINGNLVIIDEYGEDMHEKLAQDILSAISECVNGQIIITTHMTGLLSYTGTGKALKEESFYFIKNDPELPKTIQCLTDIEKRLHRNYNYRDRYFYNPLFEQYLPESGTRINEQLVYLSDICK